MDVINPHSTPHRCEWKSSFHGIDKLLLEVYQTVYYHCKPFTKLPNMSSKDDNRNMNKSMFSKNLRFVDFGANLEMTHSGEVI
jgi:hypothetical protein